MDAESRTPRDMPKRPGMRTSLVAGTVMLAVGRGVPLDAIQRRTGLTPADLVDLHGWLPERVLPTVWQVVGERFPGEPIALELASEAPTDVFGPLAQVVRFSNTLRDAIRAFARYQLVMSDNVDVKLVEGPNETSVCFSHPMDAVDGGYAAEMGLALAVRWGRELTGDKLELLRVEFTHQPIGHPADYAEHFKTPVRFGRPQNSMVFATDGLSAPTVETSPALYRFIASHLEQAREAYTARTADGEVKWLRDAVAFSAERGEYGVEPLAKHLGVSVRTLQRRARRNGLTVREMLEEARLVQAQRLLGDKRLGIEEIAFLLGYSEARAFRRAFQRWTGQTPAGFRQATRDPAR